ncbi:LysR family transcriptional regulator [Sorangium atrum]|uniref:LysR family transcriptional regulator n=1 Tax=Sorangium atrum TaxID=2995308 RepID=A0ABT5CCG8_9BACT|nr:LysR family transcriptional regulator [Sorangium aterium]MDC0684129.1 LysR family transcriptional regulator [Sorangium aterium]
MSRFIDDVYGSAYYTSTMRLQSVDTHLVVALHALLQERSVTRAARRVGVTQPSMSHALSRLRAHFGDPLLVQVGRKMTLSERARDLLPRAAEAVERLEHVFGQAERFDPRRSTRTFRLVATDNLELLVLPSLTRILAAEAPHVNLRCRNIPPDFAELLRRGELDAKLGRGGPVPDGCRSTQLAAEQLVCLMRRGHPASRKALTAARYAACGHLMISPHGEDHNVIDQELAARGLRRRVTLTVSHFLVAPFILSGSDLLLTVSARVAVALARKLDLVVRPCPLDARGYTLTLVWPERSEGDEGHSWLRAAIERAVACEPVAGLGEGG